MSSLAASGDRDDRPLGILVLADRCWSHPQAGGSGANLYAQVMRWARAGHRVTVIAGDYPGAVRVERAAPNLTVHRMGGRASVFPRAVAAVMRGIGADADVVLEVVNGITFLTPLWLRRPRVVLVCHPHRDLYVGEFGRRRGRLLSALLEELPLRFLYRRATFLTISESAADDLVAIDGVERERISVAYCGIESDAFAPGERTPQPRLIHLGRLKAYKRIEHVLDVLAAIPQATLDIVGDGDHREALEADIARRGLGDRVRMHGHVDERTRSELYARAWILLTASSSEGWGLTVIEAALCATPSAALAVGGLRESIVDGQTGILAADIDELTARVRMLLDDRSALESLGEAARRRALTFTWERTAAENLEVLRAHALARVPADVSLPRIPPVPDHVPAAPYIAGFTGPVSAERPPVIEPLPPSGSGQVTAKQRVWVVPDTGVPIDGLLTDFAARRIMTITARRPGMLELKGGSALAIGARARALDWLPVRADLLYGSREPGVIRVEASIRRRGRSHLRRTLFARLYEHKLSSWLSELDRVLSAYSEAAAPDGAPATPGPGSAGASLPAVR